MCGLRVISRTSSRTRSGSSRHARRTIFTTSASCSGASSPVSSARATAASSRPHCLAEDRFEHGVLRAEVVVDEAVGDAGLLRDVADARGLVALRREDAHGRVEDLPLLVPARSHSVS